MIITYLPRSRLRLIDCAEVAAACGQRLYQNGRALVAATAKPGPGWVRVGIMRKVA